MNGYDTSTLLDDTALSTDINDNVVSAGDRSILPDDSIIEVRDDDESIVQSDVVEDDEEINRSIVDDGSEIDAWEKALEERKLSKKLNNKLAPEEISISDDDDF